MLEKSKLSKIQVATCLLLTWANILIFQANFFEGKANIIDSFDEVYTRIPVMFKGYDKLKKVYNHYVIKLRKLTDERRQYEDENRVYSSKQMTKLLRNEKKMYNAKLAVEEFENQFDKSTDNLFVDRFKPINKILADVGLKSS